MGIASALSPIWALYIGGISQIQVVKLLGLEKHSFTVPAGQLHLPGAIMASIRLPQPAKIIFYLMIK